MDDAAMWQRQHAAAVAEKDQQQADLAAVCDRQPSALDKAWNWMTSSKPTAPPPCNSKHREQTLPRECQIARLGALLAERTHCATLADQRAAKAEQRVAEVEQRASKAWTEQANERRRHEEEGKRRQVAEVVRRQEEEEKRRQDEKTDEKRRQEEENVARRMQEKQLKHEEHRAALAEDRAAQAERRAALAEKDHADALSEQSLQFQARSAAVAR